MFHEFPVTVYYEDTDLAGVVYYANYLKFIERARSTLIRESGIDQGILKETDGLVFAVRHVDATYLKPAKLDDKLMVCTKLHQVSGVRLLFEQDILRGEEMLFSSKITVICMSIAGQLKRLPKQICAKLGR